MVRQDALINVGFAAAVFLTLIIFPQEAHAQTDIDQIISTYKTAASSWQNTITNWATGLFWLLATLEILWLGVRLVLRGADLGEFITEVVQFILFVGFFYAVLLNGYTWVSDIVEWFRNAGGAVAAGAGGSQSISPAAILTDGIDIVTTLWGHTHWDTPGYDFQVVMVGIVTLLVLGFVAAYTCEALIESYLVIGAGIIFLGFGGSRWTKDFALKIITYAVSVGAKLFFLQLIVALGMQFINQFVANPPTDSNGFAVLIGVLITLMALVLMIPSMIQSLVNGASFSTGAVLMAAVNNAASATAGGLMAGGAAGALGVAKSLASAGTDSSIARRAGAIPLGIARGAAVELPSAAVRDLGRRLSGRPGANSGTMGGRMAGDMASRIGSQNAPETPSPTPPGPSNISGS